MQKELDNSCKSTSESNLSCNDWVRWHRITTESFILRSKQVHGEDTFDYSLSEYLNSKTKVIVKCNKCGTFCEQYPHNHLSGNGCKTCQYKKLPQNQADSHENFLVRAKNVHGEKFEYLSEYVNKRAKIKIHCFQCNSIFEQRAYSHLEGYGCKECARIKSYNSQVMSIEVFESRCKEVHENRYEYYQDFEGVNNSKIKIRCRVHDFIFSQNPGAHLHKKQGCPTCNNSKGEEKVRKYLEANNINFEFQKRFSECRNRYPLPFDFYLPDYNTCIEYDGILHFEAVELFGGQENLKRTQLNDAKKSKFCQDNSIKLLRISYADEENISEIIKTFLTPLKEKL